MTSPSFRNIAIHLRLSPRLRIKTVGKRRRLSSLVDNLAHTEKTICDRMPFWFQYFRYYVFAAASVLCICAAIMVIRPVSRLEHTVEHLCGSD